MGGTWFAPPYSHHEGMAKPLSYTGLHVVAQQPACLIRPPTQLLYFLYLLMAASAAEFTFASSMHLGMGGSSCVSQHCKRQGSANPQHQAALAVPKPAPKFGAPSTSPGKPTALNMQKEHIIFLKTLQLLPS